MKLNEKKLRVCLIFSYSIILRYYNPNNRLFNIGGETYILNHLCDWEYQKIPMELRSRKLIFPQLKTSFY